MYVCKVYVCMYCMYVCMYAFLSVCMYGEQDDTDNYGEDENDETDDDDDDSPRPKKKIGKRKNNLTLTSVCLVHLIGHSSLLQGTSDCLSSTTILPTTSPKTTDRTISCLTMAAIITAKARHPSQDRSSRERRNQPRGKWHSPSLKICPPTHQRLR